MHSLVVYGASPRADAALRAVAGDTRRLGGRLTVLALAAEEAQALRCCDTKSALWNRVLRELAQEDLARAARAIEAEDGMEFRVLAYPGRRAVETVAREAEDRGADRIELADPGRCGLSRRERRRLRRRSTVPVSE